MNKWLSCVAALFLFGCASERVVLLPSPEGGKSAVVLRDANGEQELSQPYAASVRRLGLSHPYQASAEEVQARYGATLAAMPPRPVSHVLYFVSGADQLTEASLVELDTVRRLLAERPAAELVVIGHTDTVGSRESNDELSRQRAASVRAMLIEAGFPADKMEIAGRGERELLVPTANEVDEPRNRRVEINIR